MLQLIWEEKAAQAANIGLGLGDWLGVKIELRQPLEKQKNRPLTRQSRVSLNLLPTFP